MLAVGDVVVDVADGSQHGVKSSAAAAPYAVSGVVVDRRTRVNVAMKVNVGVKPGLLSICPTPSPPGPYI
jgi:hypothetical protein